MFRLISLFGSYGDKLIQLMFLSHHTVDYYVPQHQRQSVELSNIHTAQRSAINVILSGVLNEKQKYKAPSTSEAFMLATVETRRKSFRRKFYFPKICKDKFTPTLLPKATD